MRIIFGSCHSFLFKIYMLLGARGRESASLNGSPTFDYRSQWEMFKHSWLPSFALLKKGQRFLLGGWRMAALLQGHWGQVKDGPIWVLVSMFPGALLRGSCDLVAICNSASDLTCSLPNCADIGCHSHNDHYELMVTKCHGHPRRFRA